MNILVPDSWLRDFLKTKATPDEIKEYLSLCGPSVERIYKKSGEIIYDIEITGNRPDAMNVAGIAREAAAILPRFGIAATFVGDPYLVKATLPEASTLTLSIKTDPKLNPRWTSIVLTHIKVRPSPSWLTKRLEATGIRSINNVIDITNYIMRAYGQPAHAFDYDEIKGKRMVLRASKKGEKIVTLDGKAHKLPGGDIVIEDGDGRIIDLCGIMGGYNSSIKMGTTNVVLFMQTYNPANIRKTSMALSQRSEAAGLFEKGLDSQLVLPAVVKGVQMMEELAGGSVASKLYDVYPVPYKPYTVSVTKEKVSKYLGTDIGNKEIESILKSLGFVTKIGRTDVTVTVQSWRRDVVIDVDIVEEIARIYGYHNIVSKLPASAPPVVLTDTQLTWEEEIKSRLRDWGFTETYTYSMISERLMDTFGLDKHKSYKIENPLSDEWVYMRPSLVPSMLTAVKENLRHTSPLKLFELSMIYEYRPHDLPLETPMLLVAWSGSTFREAKGLSEVFGGSGSVTEVDPTLLQKLEIAGPMTIYSVRVDDLIKQIAAVKTYIPIPKYPPVIEDFSFVVTEDFRVGPFIEVLSKIHTLIKSVKLLDAYENKRTFRVTYLDPSKTLTNTDVAPVHQKFLEYSAEKFGISPVVV